MLEPIMKGLIEWIYGLIEDMADYVFGDIIDVLTMDMSYFKKAAPIVNDIAEIMLALGWALLLGNLVFQLLKSIMSGAGFEGEDPRTLFMRTFAFSFLLLASPQICEMCSKMTGVVVAYLNIPRSFAFSAPTGILFSGAGGVSWLIAIIVSIILIVQLVKLFFDIGERYVISCVLTFMAPLAFAMGGSKNTNDIFKGWCRMYGSMNLMLIMNIVFLKLIVNAMVNMWASNIIVWLVFVMALTRVARKIDAHISKIGLNPAQTSNSVGVRFPGGTTLVVVKTLASLFGKSAANMKGGGGGNSGGGGSSHHHHTGGNPSGNGGRPRNSSPPPQPGAMSTPTGDANVNVSVNSKSQVTKVSSPIGNIAGRQAGGAVNNNRVGGNTTNADNRTSPRGEGRSGENSERDRNNPSGNRQRPANVGGTVIVQNGQGGVQNKAKNITSVPAVKSTVQPSDKRSSASHDKSQSDIGREIHDNSRQNTQTAGRITTLAKGKGKGAPVPMPQAVSPSSTQTVINGNSNGVNVQSGTNIGVPETRSVPKNVTVPVVSHRQSTGRVSGTDTFTDRQVVSGTNNTDVNVPNNNGTAHGSTQSRGTVVNQSSVGMSEHRSVSSVSSHSSSSSYVSTNGRKIDPEYKFGRYDPAAANRKGKRNYYSKDTETVKRQSEHKRGEENGTAGKKHRTKGSQRSTDSRRNS